MSKISSKQVSSTILTLSLFHEDIRSTVFTIWPLSWSAALDIPLGMLSWDGASKITSLVNVLFTDRIIGACPLGLTGGVVYIRCGIYGCILSPCAPRVGNLCYASTLTSLLDLHIQIEQVATFCNLQCISSLNNLILQKIYIITVARKIVVCHNLSRCYNRRITCTIGLMWLVTEYF